MSEIIIDLVIYAVILYVFIKVVLILIPSVWFLHLLDWMLKFSFFMPPEHVEKIKKSRSELVEQMARVEEAKKGVKKAWKDLISRGNNNE